MKEWIYAIIMSIAVLFIAFWLVGCVYHTESVSADGTKIKTHIGFPEFSEGKEINIVKVN